MFRKIVNWLSQPLIILVSMLVLQVLWVISIWMTNASTNPTKVIQLLVFSSVSGFLVIIAPPAITTHARRFLDRLVEDKRLFLIVLLAVFLVIGVYYARYQRIWTFDEYKNLEASSNVAIHNLKVFFEKYDQVDWLRRQHPPLVPIINGLVMRIIGVDLLVIRLVTLAFTLGVILLSYILSRDFYGQRVAVYSTILLLTFPLVIRLGTAGLLDLHSMFFFILAILLALRFIKNPGWLLAITLGIVIGLGLLSKYLMILVYPVIVIIALAYHRLRPSLPKLMVAFAISASFIMMWLLYALSLGIKAPGVALLSRTLGVSAPSTPAMLAPATVVGPPDERVLDKLPTDRSIVIEVGWFLLAPRGRAYLANSILTKLPSGIGVYYFPLIALGVLFLLTRREKPDIVLLFWVISITILLLISIPDHRYFIFIFPAIAMIIAVWLNNHPAGVEKIFMLSFLYWLGSLYLFIDWYRAIELFSQ